MSGTIRGHCNCSSVKIEIDSSVFPKQSLLCHCRNCRASCGSVFSTNLVVPSDEVKIVSGSEHIKEYRDRNTETGHTAVRCFCALCGSPIRTYVAEANETSYVKGGLFEPGQVPPPAMEIFKRRCEEWEPLHGEVQAID
ncbi:hypothetical protein JCM1841_006330 [Sporobolomyces salmonicolor]